MAHYKADTMTKGHGKDSCSADGEQETEKGATLLTRLVSRWSFKLHELMGGAFGGGWNRGVWT